MILTSPIKMQNKLFKLLIIRYGEIALKSNQVRRQLENILARCIEETLNRQNISHKIQILPTRGRIFLYTDHLNAAIGVLKNCFGIVSLSPSFQINTDRKEIREAAIKLADIDLKEGNTFAVRTKRVGEHTFSSQDISSEVGTYILDQLTNRGITVNLTNPDHTFHIEIRDKKTYLFREIIPGLAGLPYGSQGKLISLISGGIDSPVATWLMMKRGCDIFPLYCDLSPFNTNAANRRVVEVLQKLFYYSPYQQITLYCAPHGHTLNQIKEVIPPKLTCLFCKRTMYKVAKKLANQLNAKGVVTGENLGQVASQTLDNLYILNQSIELPVFRPLIGFDKADTMNLSKKLGLYLSSIMKVPSCGAVPQYPETHGRLEEIIKIEQENSFDKLIDEEFKNIKKIQLRIVPNKSED